MKASDLIGLSKVMRELVPPLPMTAAEVRRRQRESIAVLVRKIDEDQRQKEIDEWCSLVAEQFLQLAIKENGK